MKRFISLFTFLLVVQFSIAQQGPGPQWRTIDWIPTTPTEPVFQNDLNPIAPGEIQEQEETGEDWWYDIKNTYTGTTHDGYIVCGFTRFHGYKYQTTGLFNGIFNGSDNGSGANPNYVSCDSREITGGVMSPYASVVARYDLQGKLLWYKLCNIGGDGLLGVIQDASGNFIAIGNSADIVSAEGNQLPYNPTISNSTNYFTSHASYSPDANNFQKKIVATKISPSGTIIWSHLFGPEDLNNGTATAIGGRQTWGFDLVENSTQDGYILMGVAGTANSQSQYKFTLIDIDLNGYVNNKREYGVNGNAYFARNILESNGNYFITGSELDGGFEQGVVFKVNSSLQLDASWGTTWDPSGASNPVIFPVASMTQKTVAQDLIAVGNGNLKIAVLSNCTGNCYTSGVSYGEADVFTVAANSGLILNQVQVLAETRAYDMKIGMCNTAAGGFAVLATVRNNPVSPPSNDPNYTAILNNFNSLMPANNQCQYLDGAGDQNFGFGTWNTDAFVAKYDINSVLLWSTTFDADDKPIEFYPGDFKKQECLYRITEAADGGLVFCGNTSHNTDDFYIAKVFNDCQLFANDYTDVGFGTTNYVPDLFIDQFGNPITTLTWNNTQPPHKVQGVIYIGFGQSLTIDNCTVEFADSRRTGKPTKIMVDRGGKLFIKNNAVLTSYSGCDNALWEGIEVWGNPLAVQNTTNQGSVEITDSKIENAINGVRTAKTLTPITLDWNYTGGGIVKALRSNFENCWRAFEFMSYHPLNAQNFPVNNIGFIRECNFLTDNNYGDGSDLTSPYTFISMWDTRNIGLIGNSFSNQRTTLTPEERGDGIVAIDAAFRSYTLCTVTPPNNLPCPVANRNGNTFEGLFAGVQVYAGINNASFTIDQATFTDNIYGVRLEGAHFGNVTNSTFNVPYINYGPAYPAAFGIYSSSAYGGRFEENLFNTTGSSSSRAVGIYIKDADNGGGGIKPYRNDFNLTTYGVECADDNGTLQIDCNRFYNNSITSVADIYVADGFLADQGSCGVLSLPLDPIANEFYGPCDGSNNNYQILNSSGSPFVYDSYGFYSQPCISSDVFANTCTNAPAYTRASACPSGTTSNWSNYLAQTKAAIEKDKTNIHQLKEQIDGGNTQHVLNYLSNHSNANQIKTFLLARSPYLSDTVLGATINKTLPNDVLRDILIANSSLSNKVLNVLEMYSMSNSIRNEILAAQNGEGAMRDLVKEIKYYRKDRTLYVNELVTIYLDTNMVDSAVFVLQDQNENEALCAMIPIIAKGDTASAGYFIDLIDAANNAEEKAFCKFHRFLFKTDQRPGGYFEFTAKEHQKLYEYSESEFMISTTAYGILDFMDTRLRYVSDEEHEYYEERITAPEQNISMTDVATIQLAPNPASESVSITLYGGSVIEQLFIYDISGRIIASTSVNAANYILQLEELTNGVYFIQVKTADNKLIQQKLLVNR